MTVLNVAAALFALFMIARHAPRLYRAWALRGSRADRTGVAIAALNVALALLILAAAVKALARVLI